MQRLTNTRLLAAVTALGCMALLGVSVWLTPSHEGHGTHTQLGMPPCAWALALDTPCATCGMTTSFAYAAHGHLLSSFLNQPMGSVLAVLTAALFWGAVYQLVTGARVGAAFAGLLSGRSLAIAGGMVLVSWVYKIITWHGITS